ncbi:Ketol-acid reductoisomerase [Phycisphaerae bacterium RAS1]|nr:Ketol-acid reductoisomerase [Phycisphaerae bacterium RAS1]
MIPPLPNLAAEARVDFLADRTVAVLGFGAQGAAHALNLRDSGVRTIVGQRPGGPRHAAAAAQGFSPVSIAEAARQADLLILALPDDAAPAVFQSEILPHLHGGQALGFIHGFNIHYQCIQPPAELDVLLVAPKAQGRAVRSEFALGRGVMSLIAVGQDASGSARKTALGWAAALGSARSAIFETTFKDETESDLFGEQAVLCGGLTALIQAGFDTLVAAGYPAELAYFECCHEVKLIADLIHDMGIEAMRQRISTTARYGDITRGPRVIDEHVREQMRRILDEIRSGAFAREFLAAGGRKLAAASGGFRSAQPNLPDSELDRCGARVRGFLPRA